MRAPPRIMLHLTCAAVVLIAQPASAQETKEEYVPQAERNILVEKPLSGVDGKIVSINYFKMSPEYAGGMHSHSGPTYLYVLKGTLTVEEEGKPAQTLEAGQIYEEPIGSAHQSSNQSADEATELLVIQVQDEGEPLMYQAE
ncbi:MAG: cupin domain-containing protein [Geminicoccaceae bacterium]